MAPGQVAIPRTKYKFARIELDNGDTLDQVLEKLNALGSQGFALAIPNLLRSPNVGESEAFLLLAQPIGVDIVGPGILG